MRGLGTILKAALLLRNKLQSRQHSPIQQQTNTLRRLLKKAHDTQFGQQYQFSRLLQLDDQDLLQQWPQIVPTFTYDTIYNQWWHKIIEGQRNVTWPGKINQFALSSGTSGGPTKYIPVSKDMIRAMRRTTVNMFSRSTDMHLPASFYGGQFLMVGSSTLMRPHPDNPEIRIGDVSGINAAQVPTWFDAFYKPGKRIAALNSWDERLQAIVEQAPLWDIKLIAGIPSWIQLILEAVIQRYQLQHIHQIWPNLQVYASGGVAFGPYRQRFEQLLGRPITYLDTYYTSEGCIACQTRLDGDNMPLELMLNNGIFFEFVPFDDDNFTNGELRPDAQILNIGQVKENVSYALLLSTCAGTWRYLIGDTVRFTDLQRAEITITGRTKHYLSICGEHLSVENMNSGIIQLEKLFGYTMPEFTVKAIKVANHFEHHWFIGYNGAAPTTSQQQKMATALDQHLCEINDDYATERRDNLLRHIRVQFVPAAAFIQWQAQQGRLGGQCKFPRVLTDVQFQLWLQFINQMPAANP